MEILIDESWGLELDRIHVLEQAATECVQREGLNPHICEVSLTLVSEEEICELNTQFRGIQRPTDVLSFPQYDDLSELDNEEVLMLGDVVICDDAVHRQAEEYGHSYEREFVYLFVHSILHLLGYDHMEAEEKSEMRAREEEVMDAVGLGRSPGKEEARGELTSHRTADDANDAE